MKQFGVECWRRSEKAMRKFLKVQRYGLLPTTVVALVAVALLPSFTHAFGSSNRRAPPPPPPQQANRQLVPNQRPGPPPPHHPPPPPHQGVDRRQGLPFDGPGGPPGGPPPTQGGSSNSNNPPINHRRAPQNHHGPPPHHVKHRGRPPFFPRRRPPPPPPRGRGPPPRDRERERERERDQDKNNNGPPRGRPPFKNGPPPNNNDNSNNNNGQRREEDSKLSFHIPPPPISTSPPEPQQNQNGFQQRPPLPNNPQMSESNFPQFQQNNNQPPQNLNQFPPNQQQQQFQQQQFQHQQHQQQHPQNQQHFQNQHQPQQQQQHPPQGQFPPQQNHQPQLQNNNGQFQNQPTQFPHHQQQQFAQNQQNLMPHQQQQQPSHPPPGFGPQQVPSGIPPTQFQPGPSGPPPTQFQQPGPSPSPPNGFPHGPLNYPQGFSQQLQHQAQNGQFQIPPINPSQMPPFQNNGPQLPFQPPHHQQQQPLFGQINPSPSGNPNPSLPNHSNDPSNPPILEYAPPPNTFQSTLQPEINLIQDKSKEIELNSIPKQTITFTVTPKPSQTGGTQLHFKISTPKPFKTTLKPITNSKGYFKGSTYRPPVDKLASKFKYGNQQSNPGYPDAEYRVQDGLRRESSMSAEMEPPSENGRDSIKDLLMNREHSLNQPARPHPDDTDNYAGPSYEPPPVYVKPISGEEVLIAGVSTGKSGYHKGHHDDFRGAQARPFDEDYNDSPINAHRFEEEDIGSKAYSDRHLHSYSPAKNHFDEYNNGGNKHVDPNAFRRPSPHSGSREEPFDDFDQGGKGIVRPHLHIEEESLPGSGESKRGGNRHGGKFSQPDPLYHPEDDNGSGSRERERDNGGEFDSGRYDEIGYPGSGERRHKDKDFHHHLKDFHSSKSNTAEELLAALGLSTNPLVSMPNSNSKYPVESLGKYSGSGSWEKDPDRDREVEPKRNKGNSEKDRNTSALGGEPLGLLEYLNSKKEDDPGSFEGVQHQHHSHKPLFGVPDRQVGGSAESSFVVKGSMKTGGDRDQHLHGPGKVSPSNNVIVGRPIPQYQGTEPDIITKQHIEQKSHAQLPTYEHGGAGQESYIYDKIHGANAKSNPLLEAESSVPVINAGLYGPSVPPPISEPGTFTNGPSHLSSLSPSIAPPTSGLVASASHIQPAQMSQLPTGAGESYLYQKIHGQKESNLAANLAFGPTPPSPHSVEDMSQTGLYNKPLNHPQLNGLYSAPSEQVQSTASPGLVYTQGKLVNPQQPQQTIGNGVLLPLGMNANQVPNSINSINVQGPQQRVGQQQQPFIQQQTIPQQQQPLIAQQSVPQPTVLHPQQSQIHHQQQQPLQPQQPQQQQLSNIAPQQQQIGLYPTQPPHLQQQHQPQGQHSQLAPQVVAPPQSQLQSNLYGQPGTEQIDRSAQAQQYSAEMGLQQGQGQQQASAPNPYQLHQQQASYPHPQVHGQQQQYAQNPYAQNPYQYAHPQQQAHHQNLDPSVAASNLQHQQLGAQSAVTPRYGEPYPIYVTEPDPIIEIIVQDSNMTLPPMPTFPPPPPPPPPTPEPVHVFYVKYSQKNNTPVFDNYYGQSNPQIQLEQPISSVPVRGPDRNGMLPVDDGTAQDSHAQSSVQHQNIYNSIYTTTTESTVSTTPTPSTTTTLRTIIRPDRNEFSHGGTGLVVSFDNPAVEHEIFANYTNAFLQQQQQQNEANLQLQQQQQQQLQQQYQEQQQQQQSQQPQQQPHAYPEMSFSPQAYQQYLPQQQEQQQQYPGLETLWPSLNSEQKSALEASAAAAAAEQQQQASMFQGFQKRIGLQELASLLETSPSGQEGQQQQHQQQHQQQQHEIQNAPSQGMNPNGNIHNDYQHHHAMMLQDGYAQQQQHQQQQQSDDQNPPPLYQYVESASQFMTPHHQSAINTRQAKLPEDVPEELRNQLVQSGILGNADVQVINYSENLFKELGELPPEALAAFQAHTGNPSGENKQLESGSPQQASPMEQALWSGSQVNVANSDLSSLLPAGRSLRSILVVKNSLRPKRGGKQRRVVLMITNHDDVLLYRPKDRTLRRIGTTSNPVIKRAIELSNHRMDDEEVTIAHQNHERHSA